MKRGEDIHQGRTYVGAGGDEREVLSLHMGTPPYGAARTYDAETKTFPIVRGKVLVQLVRYRNGSAEGNTARLRGRTYTCTLASFRGWARKEAGCADPA